MKPIHFNKEKDNLLIEIRSISFTDVIKAINNNQVIDTIDHPNKKKFPNQRMFIVSINKYIYVVPFVETKKEVFLKTIYQSRKYTKKYLKVNK